MHVAWSPGRTYRCFYSPSTQEVDLVSSHLVQNASGRVISGALVLVVDGAGEFCDFELTLSDENRMKALPPPKEVVRADGLVNTDVDESAKVYWSLDENFETLAISLSSDFPERWLEISSDHLYLGVSPRGQLEAIVLRSIEFDPEGKLQSSWLESLEVDLAQAKRTAQLIDQHSTNKRRTLDMIASRRLAAWNQKY